MQNSGLTALWKPLVAIGKVQWDIWVNTKSDWSKKTFILTPGGSLILGGSQKTKVKGGLPKKGRIGQFADLREGLTKKGWGELIRQCTINF